MVKLFANSGDPDQMLHSAASDLSLHCLPITLLGVSRLQWVNAAGLESNSVDPDQIMPSEMLIWVCPNTGLSKYDIS